MSFFVLSIMTRDTKGQYEVSTNRLPVQPARLAGTCVHISGYFLSKHAKRQKLCQKRLVDGTAALARSTTDEARPPSSG